MYSVPKVYQHDARMFSRRAECTRYQKVVGKAGGCDGRDGVGKAATWLRQADAAVEAAGPPRWS
jgi:hypothetical protein